MPERWQQVYPIKIIFESLLNNWFVSTKTNSMKCFVNWILLKTHVHFNRTEPYLNLSTLGRPKVRLFAPLFESWYLSGTNFFEPDGFSDRFLSSFHERVSEQMMFPGECSCSFSLFPQRCPPPPLFSFFLSWVAKTQNQAERKHFHFACPSFSVLVL